MPVSFAVVALLAAAHCSYEALRGTPFRPAGATGFSNYECTRGASQFYMHGGGEGRGKNPYRLSIRSPMFITIPFVAETMIGYKVADIPAIMGSFDPCIGETDR